MNPRPGDCPCRIVLARVRVLLLTDRVRVVRLGEKDEVRCHEHFGGHRDARTAGHREREGGAGDRRSPRSTATSLDGARYASSATRRRDADDRRHECIANIGNNHNKRCQVQPGGATLASKIENISPPYLRATFRHSNVTPALFFFFGGPYWRLAKRHNGTLPPPFGLKWNRKKQAKSKVQ